MCARPIPLLLALGAALIPGAALAQQGPPAKRTDLSRNALSDGTREAVQVLVEFEPAVAASRHSHPGEELVYVVDWALEYTLDGYEPVILRKGEVLFIAKRTIHAVRNVSEGRSAELATYIVDPAEALLIPAEPPSPAPQAAPQTDRK